MENDNILLIDDENKNINKYSNIIKRNIIYKQIVVLNLGNTYNINAYIQILYIKIYKIL